MVKKTKSALQVAARERALKKSADFHARHERLVGLAEDYFLALEERAAIQEDAEQRIRDIQKKAENDCTGADQRAAEVVRKMLDTGEPKAAVAQRLDLSSSALKKSLASLVEQPAKEVPIAEIVVAEDQPKEQSVA